MGYICANIRILFICADVRSPIKCYVIVMSVATAQGRALRHEYSSRRVAEIIYGGEVLQQK